jgi:hypothetical protein
MNHDYRALVARLVAPGGDTAGAVDAFIAPIGSTAAAERLLRPAWTAVIDAAANADQDGRAKLVALVTGVKDRTVTGPGGRDRLVDSRRLFADLPVFGDQLREAWTGPPADPAAARSWSPRPCMGGRSPSRVG